MGGKISEGFCLPFFLVISAFLLFFIDRMENFLYTIYKILPRSGSLRFVAPAMIESSISIHRPAM